MKQPRPAPQTTLTPLATPAVDETNGAVPVAEQKQTFRTEKKREKKRHSGDKRDQSSGDGKREQGKGQGKKGERSDKRDKEQGDRGKGGGEKKGDGNGDG